MESEKSLSREDLFYQLTFRWKMWLVLQVIIPVVTTICVWPVATCLFDVPDAFGKAFAGGDFLLVGALLLLGIMADLHSEQKTNPLLQKSSELDNHYLVGLTLGCVFLLAYGFFKSVEMRAEKSNLDAVAVQSTISGGQSPEDHRHMAAGNDATGAAAQEKKAEKDAERRTDGRAWTCFIGGAFAVLCSVVSTYRIVLCTLNAVAPNPLPETPEPKAPSPSDATKTTLGRGSPVSRRRP